MLLLVQKRINCIILTISIILTSVMGTQQYSQHCSVRLENALEHMRRRNSHTKSASFRSLPITPYAVYQSLYGTMKEDDSEELPRSNLYEHRKQRPFPEYDFGEIKFNRKPNSLQDARVEIEDLKVRLPQKAVRWVEVDKCKFSNINRTLDTRLIFPDLTISGKLVLFPTGGKCNMILRLRHAGIEFRTVPMAGMDESRNNRPTASVRTDSHFAEPGFISVFAHGCQGPTGIKLRQNSKRRFNFGNSPESSSDMQAEASDNRRWGKPYASSRPLYDPRVNPMLDNISRPGSRHSRQISMELPVNDEIYFDDDILRFHDELNQLEPDARAFAEIFSHNPIPTRNSHKWQNQQTYHTNTEDVSDALNKELEQLFSMGVKGLLTTYMQKTLQPAIKETLMENMGYTLSYG